MHPVPGRHARRHCHLWGDARSAQNERDGRIWSGDQESGAPDQTISSSTEFLAELAERTGGARIASSLVALRRTFSKIVTDFRSRYVLTYTPRNVSATGWHGIDVTLTNRKGEVTARRGYDRGVQ